MAELEAHRATWPADVTKLDVRSLIVQFMTTAPGSSTKLTSEEVDEEFKRLTTSYDE
jgi:hypothetical protein